MIKAFVILVLVFSVWLTYKFVQKTRDKESDTTGCFTYSIIFMLVFALSLFFFGVLGGTIKKIYNYFSLPRYEAIVIDKQESPSSSRGGTTYYHKVRFTDNEGKKLEILTDTASSTPKGIGTKITIGYQHGMEKADEFSRFKLFLLAGGSLIGLLGGYCLLFVLLFVLGKDISKVRSFGENVFQYFFFPIILLGFSGMFIYVLYEHFMGLREDLPLWVVILLCLLSLGFSSWFLEYIFKLFSKKGKDKQNDFS